MLRNEAVQSLYSRVLDNYSLDGDRILLDGEGDDEPESGDWIRLSVRYSTAPQVTLGRKDNRKFDRNGRLFVQVFTDAEIGRSNSDALVNELVDLFEGESFGGINIRNVETRETGADGKWYIQLVECLFQFETIKQESPSWGAY